MSAPKGRTSRRTADAIVKMLATDPDAPGRLLALLTGRSQHPYSNPFDNGEIIAKRHEKELVPPDIREFVKLHADKHYRKVQELVMEKFETEISFSLICRVWNGLP